MTVSFLRLCIPIGDHSSCLPIIRPRHIRSRFSMVSQKTRPPFKNENFTCKFHVSHLHLYRIKIVVWFQNPKVHFALKKKHFSKRFLLGVDQARWTNIFPFRSMGKNRRGVCGSLWVRRRWLMTKWNHADHHLNSPFLSLLVCGYHICCEEIAQCQIMEELRSTTMGNILKQLNNMTYKRVWVSRFVHMFGNDMNPILCGMKMYMLCDLPVEVSASLVLKFLRKNKENHRVMFFRRVT